MVVVVLKTAAARVVADTLFNPAMYDKKRIELFPSLAFSLSAMKRSSQRRDPL
jgi:hypothetical protein